MLSFSGFVFLLLVGVLIIVQPQYMKLGKSVSGPAPVFESGAWLSAFLAAKSSRLTSSVIFLIFHCSRGLRHAVRGLDRLVVQGEPEGGGGPRHARRLPVRASHDRRAPAADLQVIDRRLNFPLAVLFEREYKVASLPFGLTLSRLCTCIEPISGRGIMKADQDRSQQ